jgi:hypothetical protein
MATISVRVPDELAARFRRAAAAVGGQGPLVRQLIGTAAGSEPAPPSSARRLDTTRVFVRLAAAEVAKLDVEAEQLGLRRASWIAALVRRRLLHQPTFAPADQMLLIGVRAELRRIGVNVNQIARAMNTAVLEGRVLDAELTAIDDFRGEVRAHIQALSEAFEGNLAYWQVGP